jgi:hypothetical protein
MLKCQSLCPLRYSLGCSAKVTGTSERSHACSTIRLGQLRYRFRLAPPEGDFECLLTPAQIVDLQRKLKKLVGRDDSLRFYFISADDVKRIALLGGVDVTVDRLFILH